MPNPKGDNKGEAEFSVAETTAKADTPYLTYDEYFDELAIDEIEARQKTRLILLVAGIAFATLAIVWGVSLHPIATGIFTRSGLISEAQINLWHMIPLIAFTAAASFLLIAAHRRIEVTDLLRSGADVVTRTQGDTGL